MTLLSPWFLLGLVPVAAVAAWAMFRPARQLVVVSSLSLWNRAQRSMGRSLRRPARRATLWWAALLVGASLCVLALARPVWTARSPRRRLAIAIYPSAELGGEGMKRLRKAVGRLLDRLNGADEVRLLLPDVLGGGAWVSPAEARKRISNIPLLPVPAGRLSLPAAGASCDRVYYFVPAGTRPPGSPAADVIELATSAPDVTLKAIAAEGTADGAVQLFAAVRNHSDSPRSVSLRVRLYDRNASVSGTVSSPARRIAPASRGDLIVSCPPAAAYSIAVIGDNARKPAFRQVGYLVRRKAIIRKVAMIGPDQPLLRRFVKVDPALELVSDVSQADIVFANSAEPPAGIPSLLVNPRRSPAGWRRGKAIGPVLLGGASRSADDAVMRNVSLSGLAVRRCRPWIASDATPQVRLVTYRGDGLILRTQPGPFDARRRIYVAFDLSAGNTNFSMSEAFVVFLANAVRWLGGGGQTPAPAENSVVRYEYVTALRAYRPPGWRRVAGPKTPRVFSPLPWPGLYRDRAGVLHAVSLVHLRYGRVQTPPETAVAALTLPEPRPAGGRREYWPILIAAAALLWLVGWILRLR